MTAAVGAHWSRVRMLSVGDEEYLLPHPAGVSGVGDGYTPLLLVGQVLQAGNPAPVVLVTRHEHYRKLLPTCNSMFSHCRTM